MAHKSDNKECPRVKDSNAACTCPEETPTRLCADCGQEIGKTEKKCPKCNADLEVADAEDEVVSRSLKRLAAKNKKKKPAPTPTPEPSTEPTTKKHPFAGLGKVFNR